jgi:hypothetical protein
VTTRVPARVALVGAGRLAAVAIPAAGAAYAATATHHPAGATTHSTHTTKHKKKTFTVTTKVADVQIRTKPDSTKATKVLTVVKTAGTALKVTRYKTATAPPGTTPWPVGPANTVPPPDVRLCARSTLRRLPGCGS